jgi:hypothetical protein
MIPKDIRDRIAYYRKLAVDSLEDYRGGFAALERVDRNLKSIIRCLEDIADPLWTSSLFKQWGELEIIYALVLDDGRLRLTQEEEAEVRGIVAGLLADLQSYDVPLYAEDKPEEGDVVRLRRSLPEHHLPAGSQGTVVVDYAKYSGGDEPFEYEVEFADSDGARTTLLTVSEGDVEIVSRPGYSKSPS